MAIRIKKHYVLYDLRALTDDTFDCTVYESSYNLEELRQSAADYGGGVIYSYDEEYVEDGNNRKVTNLINETLVGVAGVN